MYIISYKSRNKPIRFIYWLSKEDNMALIITNYFDTFRRVDFINHAMFYHDLIDAQRAKDEIICHVVDEGKDVDISLLRIQEIKFKEVK